MRAILLASATAATLYGRRAIRERTQAGSFTPRLASLRIDVAPTISLELQGFDIRESEDVFEELAARYADGLFPFRPKRHLKPA
ncbi:MAG: hypothetical protein KMY49_04110 [Hoeflea sp.]|nr:hypothetical protein [Hoeflea sp.]